MTFTKGLPARCNRCNKEFDLPKDREGSGFDGNAARLKQTCACPHCEQTDSHWIFASDLIARIVKLTN